MVDRQHNLSKRYPEVMRFDSRKEADKAVQACKKQLIKTPGFWFGLVGYTAGVGLAVFLIIMSCRGWIPISHSMLGGVVGGVTGASGTVAHVVLASSFSAVLASGTHPPGCSDLFEVRIRPPRPDRITLP